MDADKTEIEKLLVKAQSRIASLESENYRLKKLLHLQEHSELSADKNTREAENKKKILIVGKPSVSIHKHSSAEDKVALFRSLFKGREDVFAIRWEGTNGKSGYSPACDNSWRSGVCGRYKNIPCAKCESRNLISLSYSQYTRHLTGEIVIGIYPLLESESCHFLALDFDKKQWQEDIRAFRKTCEKYNVPAYIERSRSGNGAHVWIFFQTDIAAALAHLSVKCS
ncbi:MAG: hypothetical protein K9N06_07805 [Candidatus Cloacimonetes bacterium]|nr:hypothetical protein [Candidatus Cloacimonadota bacterium]